MYPSTSKKSLYYGLFRLLAHEYLFELSLHSCSSSRFSTIYSKNTIPTDLEIVCEMGVIVYEMGVIVCKIGVLRHIKKWSSRLGCSIHSDIRA